MCAAAPDASPGAGDDDDKAFFTELAQYVGSSVEALDWKAVFEMISRASPKDCNTFSSVDSPTGAQLHFDHDSVKVSENLQSSSPLNIT